jgi:UDP-N-acetylglucosamine 4,6-dehydratase
VLGSRGSLLPHWQDLLKAGATSIPITDAKMTRFWITIQQAVQFVIDSFDKVVGGEIFIPKSPSVRIVDLAKAFAPKIPHTICGIRPGEKIDEVLLSQDDSRFAFDCKDRYLVASPVSGKAYEQHKAASKHVPEGFILASNTNPLFIDSIQDIEALIRSAHFEPSL